jgi:peptide/nickel transport system substrate-binding protein
MPWSRRDLLAAGGAAGLYAATGTANRAHAETPKRGGTLRAIVNPEPPGLIMALNQLLPTCRWPARSTRACCATASN